MNHPVYYLKTMSDDDEINEVMDLLRDRLFGIVVTTSDYHPRGPGFDSWLHPINISGSIGSGMGSTQPR